MTDCLNGILIKAEQGVLKGGILQKSFAVLQNGPYSKVTRRSSAWITKHNNDEIAARKSGSGIKLWLALKRA